MPERDGARAPRSVIVNAEDFGRSEGVNRGIVRAHEYGIVTSASLMVRWPAAAEAAALARSHPLLDVGLHVDLTEWELRDGEWRQVYEVVPLDDPPAVAGEIQRQIDEFRRLVGRPPSHLDGHQGIHRNPVVASALIRAAASLGVPLRDHAPGIRSEGGFYGRTSKGEPYPRGIAEEALIGILDRLRHDVTEIRCHPGEANGWDGAGYLAEREREIVTLCHPEVRAALVRRGLRLSSFRDLPERMRVVTPHVERFYRDEGIQAYRRRAYDEADRWFERAVEEGARQRWNWLWRARSRLALGDREGSHAANLKALELSPDWPLALLHAADLGEGVGGGGAVEALDRLHALHAREKDVLRAIAGRFLDLDELGRARAVAEDLLRLDPADEEGVLTLARSLWRSGQRAEAKRILDEALETERESAATAAVRFHLETGDPAAARRAARAIGESRLPAGTLMTIAGELRRVGYVEAARETFHRIASTDPENASARKLADRLAGEEAVLRGTWRPPVVPAAGPLERVPGRVIHLVAHSLPHHQVGYTVRTHSIARAQIQAGLDPRVLTQLGFPWTMGARSAPAEETFDGVRYHRLEAAEGVPDRLDERLSANLVAAADLVRHLRPSLLHAASDYRNGVLAIELGRAYHLPVVYEVRGFWEETRLVTQGSGASRRQCYRWHRRREVECMDAADRIVTLTAVMAEEIARRGIPAEKIVVVPNAVDPEVFAPVERDAALGHALGLPEGEPVVGYISSLTRYEGIPVLLEAVGELRRRGWPIRCLVVGDGSERSSLERRAAELGLGEHAVFTGRVPYHEILRYYSLIDVFVVPRVEERVTRLVAPLKPFEAMAMARAVVASDVAGLRDSIEEGVNARLFRAGDARDLARVVESLLGSPAEREALGRSARAWVCENRTWKRNGELYRELYRSLGAV